MNNSTITRSGTIRLVNAVFYAHHGVTKEEHQVGGRYEVDVAMSLDFEEAAETDKLSNTVDYEGVYGLVHQIVTGNKFYLIEKLAVLISRSIMDGYPLVNTVEVTVRATLTLSDLADNEQLFYAVT